MTKSASQSSKIAKFQKKHQRQPNSKLRSREYLTSDEIESLRKAARSVGRHTHRDDTLILLMFRHGLRVGEAIDLQWDQIDLKQGIIHVARLKNGKPATHPLYSVEIRALRKLQRDYSNSRYLFVSERKAPLTSRTAHHIIARAGRLAQFEFSIHPHMLRHSTGFYLANKGTDTRAIQAYLGHSNINNTVIYTELSPERFKNIWRD
jgi:site-specific recombinase XerD